MVTYINALSIRHLRFIRIQGTIFSMLSSSLQRYAWLSIVTAVATILLKGAAWWLTGSVGLLSDAIESFVNLAGALMALWMLTVAAAPADATHPYGHDKAEYFSSAFEGVLILLAAFSIGYTAVERLLNPQPLEGLGLGLLVSVLASLINLATARTLLKVGRAQHSIALEADAHHLFTDVWTSVGVLIGLGLVWISGFLWLDSVVALVVAANIIWTGWHLMQRSASGLMDSALPSPQLQQLHDLLVDYRAQGLDFHALRTRQSGRRAFVMLHVLVPGSWTVQQAHDWSERIEADMRRRLPHAHITIHLEPLGDPLSNVDQDLDRSSS